MWTVTSPVTVLSAVPENISAKNIDNLCPPNVGSSSWCRLRAQVSFLVVCTSHRVDLTSRSVAAQIWRLRVCDVSRVFDARLHDSFRIRVETSTAIDYCLFCLTQWSVFGPSSRCIKELFAAICLACDAVADLRHVALVMLRLAADFSPTACACASDSSFCCVCALRCRKHA